MIDAYIAQNDWQLNSVYTDISYGNDMNKSLLKMIEDLNKEKSMLLLQVILHKFQEIVIIYLIYLENYVKKIKFILLQ